jgi:hypothetical protein
MRRNAIVGVLATLLCLGASAQDEFGKMLQKKSRCCSKGKPLP